MRPFGLAILDQLVYLDSRSTAAGFYSVCFYTVSETVAGACTREKSLLDLALRVIDEHDHDRLVNAILLDVAAMVEMGYLEGTSRSTSASAASAFGELPSRLVVALTYKRLWISVALP